jgi:hypothetical protein
MKAKIFLYYLGAAIFFVIALVSLTLLSWNIVLQGIGTIGGTMTFTFFLVLLFNAIPQLQKALSYMARALSFWRFAELASVKLSIEGNLNSFKGTVDDEAKGAIPYPVKVEWVTKETPETFIDKYKGEVVVRMRHHSYQPRNLAYAAINYISKGLLPLSRLYLDEKVETSIDLTMTRKVLAQQKQKEALDYFLMEILNPKMSDQQIRNYLAIMGGLDEEGHFTRILIRELTELGRSLYPKPDQIALKESSDFVDLLHQLSEKEPGKDISPTYKQKRIRVAIMLVARREKFYEVGPEPYVLWAKARAEEGYDSLYLLARGANLGPAKIIRKEIEKLQTLKKVEGTDKIYTVSHEGRPVDCVCIVFRRVKGAG